MTVPRHVQTALVVSGCLLLAFHSFSRTVRTKRFDALDMAATVKVQERIDKSARLRLAAAAGEVMEGAVFFASPTATVVTVLVISVIAAWDRKRKRIRWAAAMLPFALMLLVAGEIYGKQVVHHPGPPFFLIKNPTTVFPKYYVHAQFSYPSGHTARAVFMAAAATYAVWSTLSAHKRATIVVGTAGVGFAVLVSVSLIYLGHHWLTDIVGGWLLGGGTVTVALAMLFLWDAATKPRQKLDA